MEVEHKAVGMEGTCVDKQIGSGLVCTVGGQDVCRRRYEINDRRYFAVGDDLRGGADKSLARPGKKRATATRLGIYSIYSPRSSVYFLARCSNFRKPLKNTKSEGCRSNQVSAAAMTSASDEKWRPFSCFFSPGNRW